MEINDVRNLGPTNYGDWLGKYGEAWKTQVEQLRRKFPDAIEEVMMPVDHPTDIPVVFVKKEQLPEVLRFMKSEPGFEYDFLTDYTATDEFPGEPRFHVVIHLFSASRMWRIRIKSRVAEGEKFPSLMSVWRGADWAECEIWDMYGIPFEGRPDIKRVLMHEDWEGHPLRKDYPLRGYQVIPVNAPIDEKTLNRESES